MQTKPRLSEIDRLKGLAILFVVLIHARPLADTFPHDVVINRAVPMFVVLFGLNSYLWWGARAELPLTVRLRDWYVSRFWRLMPPVWGMLLLWWPMQLYLWDPPLRGTRFIVATFLGYLPWVGTGWFVTTILALVVVYPLFLAFFAMLGPFVTGIAGFMATFSTGLYSWQVIELMRRLLRNSAPFSSYFYVWVFPPIFGWHLAAGVLLARFWSSARGSIVCGTTVLGLALFAMESLSGASPFFVHSLRILIDVPVTVAMLWVVWWIPAGNALDRCLRWLGVRSWGLYLGQLLVHNAFWLGGRYPFEGPLWVRWFYAMGLLGGAILLTETGQRVRTGLGGWLALHRSSAPA